VCFWVARAGGWPERDESKKHTVRLLRVSQAIRPRIAGKTHRGNHPTCSYLSRTQARSRSHRSVDVVSPRDTARLLQLALYSTLKTLRVSPTLCPGNAGETRWINKKGGFGFENHPTRSYLSHTQARSRSYQSVDVVSPRDATGQPQLASVLRSYA
jgi:hypothetical protein